MILKRLLVSDPEEATQAVMVSDSTIICDALAEHYLAQGLPSDGGANDSWFRGRIGPVSFRLPNLRGRGSVSIYRDPPAPHSLAAMTVARVRRHLALDAEPATTRWTDALAFAMWALTAVSVLLAPAIAILGAARLGLRTWLR